MRSVARSPGRAGSWLWRPSLSRRIAVAMVLSLVAIQGQMLVQIRLLSNPEFRLTGMRWLAEAVRDVSDEVFKVSPEDRGEFLTKRSAGTSLRLGWRQTFMASEPDDSHSAIGARLAATLRDVLADRVRDIHVRASTLRYRFPVNELRVVVMPPELGPLLSKAPVQAGAPDVLMPAGVKVAVQGPDGSWLTVEPVGFDDGALWTSLPYAPLLVGGLIIAVVSTLLARRLVAPLDRLVIAAERIGTAREPVSVPTEGLHEFSTVARTFEEMQHRLLRFVDDRTQMLAAISHDLRSALTRLRLAAEQCAGEAERAALSAEIDDMQAMVESTLAFASGEAQLAPNRPTDVASLLISLVDEASDAGQPCSYEGPDHVETMAHPVSLKRAFRNVMDNAVKYGHTARVSLTIEAAKLSIVVDDDGPGVPEARMEDVFAPFRRLDTARTQDKSGAGLGLTIARDVVQSHGGTIRLLNRQGGGLRVAIELPRR